MPQQRLFLERASLRRRRLGDAARMLPCLATFVLLVPVMWLPGLFATAAGMIWLFSGWAVAIAVIGLLHHALTRAEAGIADTEGPADAP